MEIENFIIHDAMPRSNTDAWIVYTEANDNSTTVQVGLGLVHYVKVKITVAERYNSQRVLAHSYL